MDQLRRALENIRAQLGKLRGTHKLLIGLVVVVLGLVLFIISQTGGRVQMTEVLPGGDPALQQSAAAHLGSQGFRFEMRSGRVAVPPQDRQAALASLGEARLLPNDKAILWENILREQSWTNSRQQNDALFNEALQNELGHTISRFAGIKAAEVFIDVPPPMGLGAGVRRPTASVSVTTRSGEGLSQEMVNAIAGFIAGSKAGLTKDNVAVIDAASGRQRRATRDEDALPTTYLDHAARVEQQTREKVQELLQYIPGVIVAVTAQVDVTRVESSTSANLDRGQGSVALPRRTESTSSEQKQTSTSAAPGVEANQTADITRASAGPGSSTVTQSDTEEFENHVGTRTERTVDPRGFPTWVAVSVNVPRSFITQMLRAQQESQGGGGAEGSGADAPALSDQQIADAFEQQVRPAILAQLTPQVRALSVQSGRSVSEEELRTLVAQTISVSLIPFDTPGMLAMMGGGVAGGAAGSGGAGGTLAGAMQSGLVDKAVLGVLAVASLGLMFMLVRRGGKKMDTPTAEELVGLPPALEAAADVVGEAAEGETAMAGIEVGEDEMQSQKMLEQVKEMVKSNPEQTAKMLNRWISNEE